ncbi:flavin reductase family protein [Saccharopolyspora oryzae]|uniref:Flavin reductase family protein n=1 Tax=Saccharopolyspora oryzae TaxID=2997343 RepID=A0ABT4US22_9PSEU|nr:flavin reductase family protein [Saccharopolyspora oryzae]MDA3623867.1 flavin reductase family protein [Saccharopolyspora oryzae]
MALPAFQAANAADMRRSMGRFTTGVAIVTSGVGDSACGMTISSLTSICLDPAILLVSLTEGARTTGMVADTGRFAVSILAARQEAIARRFATRGGARFEGLDCEYGEYGVPMIEDALVQAECDVHSAHQVGDHAVFYGLVRNLRCREGTGLAFYSGRFGDFHDFGHDEMPWMF